MLKKKKDTSRDTRHQRTWKLKLKGNQLFLPLVNPFCVGTNLSLNVKKIKMVKFISQYQ